MDNSQQASNNFKYDFVLHHPLPSKEEDKVSSIPPLNICLPGDAHDRADWWSASRWSAPRSAGREEGVKPHNQLGVALEQHGHAGDDAMLVNRL